MDDPDSGLLDAQGVAERTALAWQRTVIGVLAVGALVVRWSITERFPPWPGVALTAVAALAALVLVRQRYQRVRDTVGAGQTPLSRYLVPGATLFMVVVVVGIGAGMLLEYSRL
ncbi:DUF202 domain-containing protein [Mycobacterium sp. shizuoka-1]|uniref:DUF202 domain-containing protein n=1 Tax=Mycobacterium sp. shizuoka-1 TaxID=2039281 RepID=UPI000C063DA1|nr:DUF202 domain-containing protein [Mycobacterium sp. shizuoka-1]GAY18404.1 hypothetical protein MSZK_51300 [Mycobacterium sp. shizuoka-1]